MPADKKWLMLVKRIYERTQESKVPWEETADEGIFKATFKDYSVRISTQENPLTDEVDYILSIYNPEGALIDQVSDPDFESFKEEFKAYRVMQEVYASARRIARGIDKAIDALLAELDEEDVPS